VRRFATLVNPGLRKRIHRVQSACTFCTPPEFCLVTLSTREHDHGA
jgi:hypothetical protein